MSHAMNCYMKQEDTQIFSQKMYRRRLNDFYKSYKKGAKIINHGWMLVNSLRLIKSLEQEIL